MFVPSYSVTYCIYVPGKPGICFQDHCEVYDECKYSDTFWLADRTRLFAQYIISLSSLCKLIWWHWIYKMPVRYNLSSVWVRLSISVIHYTICGAVCLQFTHFSFEDWENIYTLSYYHNQIGSMNYYPLFRVRSWNNAVRCMSFYILIIYIYIYIHIYHELGKLYNGTKTSTSLVLIRFLWSFAGFQLFPYSFPKNAQRISRNLAALRALSTF